MKLKTIITTVAALALSLTIASAAKGAISLNLKSSYIDMIDKAPLKRDAVKDYGLKSGTADQSAALQSAIDAMAKMGGGVLTIPAGEYPLNGIMMRSNIHIVVDKGVTFRLAKNQKKAGGVLFNFSNDGSKGSERSFIENCSIRCAQEGEQYLTDVSEYENDGTSVRFAIARMVRNFLIADVCIKDNYTLHCGLTFTPADVEEDASSWEVSRPTHGEIRNCSILNGNSGYGLCQLHGANDLYFENLYSLGGVTLRLESGAGGMNAGVYDIRAHKVHSKNARASLMMSPHTAQNGVVLVDGISSESSAGTVLIHKGFMDKKSKKYDGLKVGTYAKGSHIVNIHGVYGELAQVHDKEVFICEPVGDKKEYYKKFKFNDFDNPKCYIAPSYAIVYDGTHGEYTVKCENITGEGFPSHNNSVLFEQEISDRYENRGDILKSLPDYRPRPAKTPKK